MKLEAVRLKRLATPRRARCARRARSSPLSRAVAAEAIARAMSSMRRKPRRRGGGPRRRVPARRPSAHRPSARPSSTLESCAEGGVQLDGDREEIVRDMAGRARCPRRSKALGRPLDRRRPATESRSKPAVSWWMRRPGAAVGANTAPWSRQREMPAVGHRRNPPRNASSATRGRISNRRSVGLDGLAAARFRPHSLSRRRIVRDMRFTLAELASGNDGRRRASRTATSAPRACGDALGRDSAWRDRGRIRGRARAAPGRGTVRLQQTGSARVADVQTAEAPARRARGCGCSGDRTVRPRAAGRAKRTSRCRGASGAVCRVSDRGGLRPLPLFPRGSTFRVHCGQRSFCPTGRRRRAPPSSGGNGAADWRLFPSGRGGSVARRWPRALREPALGTRRRCARPGRRRRERAQRGLGVRTDADSATRRPSPGDVCAINSFPTSSSTSSSDASKKTRRAGHPPPPRARERPRCWHRHARAEPARRRPAAARGSSRRAPSALRCGRSAATRCPAPSPWVALTDGAGTRRKKPPGVESSSANARATSARAPSRKPPPPRATERAWRRAQRYRVRPFLSASGRVAPA